MGVVIIPPAPGVNQTGVTQIPQQTYDAVATPVSATAAANTAVVITVALAFAAIIRLQSLSFDYNAAPTGGLVTVTSNGVTLLQLDVLTSGIVTIPLPPGGIAGAAGQSMIITLAAAGAAVTGKLNIGYTQR